MPSCLTTLKSLITTQKCPLSPSLLILNNGTPIQNTHQTEGITGLKMGKFPHSILDAATFLLPNHLNFLGLTDFCKLYRNFSLKHPTVHESSSIYNTFPSSPSRLLSRIYSNLIPQKATSFFLALEGELIVEARDPPPYEC